MSWPFDWMDEEAKKRRKPAAKEPQWGGAGSPPPGDIVEEHRAQERAVLGIEPTAPPSAPPPPSIGPIKSTLQEQAAADQQYTPKETADRAKQIAKIYSLISGGSALLPDVHLALALSGLSMDTIAQMLKIKPEGVSMPTEQQRQEAAKIMGKAGVAMGEATPSPVEKSTAQPQVAGQETPTATIMGPTELADFKEKQRLEAQGKIDAATAQANEEFTSGHAFDEYLTDEQKQEAELLRQGDYPGAMEVQKGPMGVMGNPTNPAYTMPKVPWQEVQAQILINQPIDIVNPIENQLDNLAESKGSYQEAEAAEWQLRSVRDQVAAADPATLPEGVSVASIDDAIAQINHAQEQFLREVQGPIGDATDPSKVFADAAWKSIMRAPTTTFVAEANLEDFLVDYNRKRILGQFAVDSGESKYNGLVPVRTEGTLADPFTNTKKKREEAQNDSEIIAIDPDSTEFEGIVGFKIPKTQAEIKEASAYWQDKFWLPANVGDMKDKLSAMRPWEIGIFQRFLSEHGYPTVITEKMDDLTILAASVYYNDMALQILRRGEREEGDLVYARADSFGRSWGANLREMKVGNPALFNIQYDAPGTPETEAGLSNEEKQAAKLIRQTLMSHLQIGALSDFGKDTPGEDPVLKLAGDAAAGRFNEAFPNIFEMGQEGGIGDRTLFEMYLRTRPPGELPQVTVGRYALEYGEEALPHEYKENLLVTRGDVWKERLGQALSTVVGGADFVDSAISAMPFEGEAWEASKMAADVLWDNLIKPVGGTALGKATQVSDYAGRALLWAVLVDKAGIEATLNGDWDTFVKSVNKWNKAVDAGQIKNVVSPLDTTQANEEDAKTMYADLGISWFDPQQHPFTSWLLDFGLESIATLSLGAAVRGGLRAADAGPKVARLATAASPFLKEPLQLADETKDLNTILRMTNYEIGVHGEGELARRIADGDDTVKVIEDWAKMTGIKPDDLLKTFEPSPAMVWRQVRSKLLESEGIDKIPTWFKPFIVVPPGTSDGINFDKEKNVYDAVSRIMQANRFTTKEQDEWMLKLDDALRNKKLATDVGGDMGQVTGRRIRDAFLEELQDEVINRVYAKVREVENISKSEFLSWFKTKSNYPRILGAVDEQRSIFLQKVVKNEAGETAVSKADDASAINPARIREETGKVTELNLLQRVADTGEYWDDTTALPAGESIIKFNDDIANMEEWLNQYRKATDDFLEQSASPDMPYISRSDEIGRALENDEAYQNVQKLYDTKLKALRESESYLNADDVDFMFGNAASAKELGRLKEAVATMRKAGFDFADFAGKRPTAAYAFQLTDTWRPRVPFTVLSSLQHGKFIPGQAREAVQKYVAMDQIQQIWKRLILAGWGTQAKIAFDDLSRLIFSGINPFSALWNNWKLKGRFGLKGGVEIPESVSDDIHNLLYNALTPPQHYSVFGDGGLRLTRPATEWYLNNIATEPLAKAWVKAEREAIEKGLDEAARAEYTLNALKEPLKDALGKAKAFKWEAYPQSSQGGLAKLLHQRGDLTEQGIEEFAKKQEDAFRYAAKLGDERMLSVFDKFAKQGKKASLTKDEWAAIEDLQPVIFAASDITQQSSKSATLWSHAQKGMDKVGDAFYWPLTHISANTRGSVYLYHYNRKMDDLLGGMDEVTDYGQRNAEWLADAYARRMVDEITYNTARTPMEHALRNIIPFGPAYRDFYIYWTKHFAKRPEQLLPIIKMQQMPDEAKVSAKTFESVPWVGGMVSSMFDHAGIGPESVWRVSPKSALFFTGGASSFLPSFGIFVTAPVSALIQSDPDAYSWLSSVPGLSFANPNSAMFAKWDKLIYAATGEHLPKVGPIQLGTKDTTTDRQILSEFNSLLTDEIEANEKAGKSDPYPTDRRRQALMEQAKENVKRQYGIGFAGSFFSPAGNRLETEGTLVSRAKSLLYAAESPADRQSVVDYLTGKTMELPDYLKQYSGSAVLPVPRRMAGTISDLATAIGSPPSARKEMMLNNPMLAPLLVSTTERTPDGNYRSLTPEDYAKRVGENMDDQRIFEKKYLNSFVQASINRKWDEIATHQGRFMESGEAALTPEQYGIRNLESAAKVEDRGGYFPNYGAPTDEDTRAFAAYQVTTVPQGYPSRFNEVFGKVQLVQEKKRIEAISTIKGSDLTGASKAELAQVGLPTDDATLKAIRDYQMTDNQLRREMEGAGVSGYSTKAGSDYAARLDAKIDELAAATPGFSQIYEMSKQPEWMRAKAMGIGNQNLATKGQWDEAYRLLDEMTAKMADAKSKDREAIRKEYMAQIEKLTNENEAFKKEFGVIFKGKDDLKPTAAQLRAYKGDYDTSSYGKSGSGGRRGGKRYRRSGGRRKGRAKSGGVGKIKSYKGKRRKGLKIYGG